MVSAIGHGIGAAMQRRIVRHSASLQCFHASLAIGHSVFGSAWAVRYLSSVSAIGLSCMRYLRQFHQRNTGQPHTQRPLLLLTPEVLIGDRTLQFGVDRFGHCLCGRT
jgi:hypothetical protein